MAKVMLVEDDNNLREIYEARLLAEGYDIVSAQDGEEALALAVKEKPDLIIADIMMPKISGFDMLDILRSTPETKETKVVMMTALSQAEDKERANKLGADRYLVKSQVTLEDVARVAREVLEGKADSGGGNAAPVAGPPDPAGPSTPPEPPAPTTPPTDPPATADPPPTADPPATDQPTADPKATATAVALDPQTNNNAMLADALSSVGNVSAAPERPTVTAIDGENTAVHTKVIKPIHDITAGPNINDLVAKEEAKESEAKQADAAAKAAATVMPAAPSAPEPTTPAPAAPEPAPFVLGRSPAAVPTVASSSPAPVKVVMGEIGRHEELPAKPIAGGPAAPTAADPNAIAL